MNETGVPPAILDRYVRALLAADRRKAGDAINDALFGGASGIAVLDELIRPAMHEIGRLWEAGEVSIADEHLATEISRQMLDVVAPHLAVAEQAARPRVLLAGVEGELHTLGLSMVDDLLSAQGYDVLNAGSSLPADALVAAVQRHLPWAVGLSNTLAENAPHLIGAVSAVHSVQPDLPIFVGGAASMTVQTDTPVFHCATVGDALRVVTSVSGG